MSFYYFVSVLVVYCGAPVLRMRGALANDMIWYDDSQRVTVTVWRYKVCLIERWGRWFCADSVLSQMSGHHVRAEAVVIAAASTDDGAVNAIQHAMPVCSSTLTVYFIVVMLCAYICSRR